MIDDELAKKILELIESTGAAHEDNQVVSPLIGRTSEVLDRSAGLPRIKKALADKFILILGQPIALSFLSNLQIRCALCGKVISYPAWYAVVKYAVNQLHFFICFDAASPLKPTTRCYRRG
jgi:hypothetical protein